MNNLKQFDLLAALPKESLKEITFNEFESNLDHTKIDNGIDFEMNQKAPEPEPIQHGFSNFTQDFTQEPGQQNPDPENSGPANLNLGEVINSKQATEILDILLVATLSIGFKFLKVKVNKSDLKATAAEKSTIEPILKKVIDSMNLKFDNPLNALMVTLAIVYGTKGAEIFVNEKLNKKEDPTTEDKSGLGFFVSNPPTAKRPKGRPKKS